MPALASENNAARKGASTAISSIGVIELCDSQWPELIPTLINGAKSNNQIAQEGTLSTIGLICEDIVRILFYFIFIVITSKETKRKNELA